MRLRVIALACVFVACEGRTLRVDGRVVQRVYEPAHNTSRVMFAGKVPVTQQIHHDEAYRLRVTLGSGPPLTLDVSASEYARVHEGDAIPLDVDTNGCETVRRTR